MAKVEIIDSRDQLTLPEFTVSLTLKRDGELCIKVDVDGVSEEDFDRVERMLIRARREVFGA